MRELKEGTDLDLKVAVRLTGNEAVRETAT
jgi:hypothetical protein